MTTRRVIDDAPMLFVCGMSRSGTTLLTTIFDAHSDISMGAELIPGPGLRIAGLRDALERGLRAAHGDFTRCGSLVRKEGDREHGTVLTRCARAGLTADQTRRALAALQAAGLTEATGFADRMEVAWRLMRERRAAEGTDLFGFKLNAPALEAAHGLFPGARFACIVRDPRDVVASHRKRGFERTTKQVCHAWLTYTEASERMVSAHPQLAALTRYEQLVGDPQAELERLFAVLPVAIEPAVFSFATSQAAVFTTGHPNVEQLRRGFFTSSVGSWRQELSAGEVADVERLCAQRLGAYAMPA